MIDLHYWPTPNSHKVTIFLEEAEVPYSVKVVDLGKGDQFDPTFLAISPNNRMPAIVDHAPAGSGTPISMFESGAILVYLAEKHSMFFSEDPARRAEILQWLFWQMAGLGPMAGQNGHFRRYAPEPIPYAINRYTNEMRRLFTVLETRLADRPFLAQDYSIADMACYPWALMHDRQGLEIEDFPAVRRWLQAIGERPAVIRAYRVGEPFTPVQMDEEARKNLFNQDGSRLGKAK